MRACSQPCVYKALQVKQNVPAIPVVFFELDLKDEPPDLIKTWPPPPTIGGPEKLSVLNKAPTVLRAPGGLGDNLKRAGIVWVIRFRIFRAPKSKHNIQGLPRNGLTLNKGRTKHVQGLFTKASAALIGFSCWGIPIRLGACSGDQLSSNFPYFAAQRGASPAL